MRGIKIRLVGYTGNGYYIEDQKGNFHCTRDIRWNSETTTLQLRTVYNNDSDSDNDSQDSEADSSQDESGPEDSVEQAPRSSEDSARSFQTVDNDNRQERLNMESRRNKIDNRNVIQGKRHRKTRFDARELEAIERLIGETNIVYRDMQYHEAMQENDKDSWIQGVEEEFSNLVKLKSFKETILPAHRKAIATRWVMHRKTDGRYRPRLVFKGFQQVAGLDYTNSYAPVAGYHIFRLTLAIAAAEGLRVATYDC